MPEHLPEQRSPSTETAVAGCDVSKSWIDICKRQAGTATLDRFANTAQGHEQLCQWIDEEGEGAGGAPREGAPREGAPREGAPRVRVAVEASGAYSLDLALALHDRPSVEVMIVHPRALKDYRRAHLKRSKTDRIDARMLCDYCWRMPFARWEPPAEAARQLRAITRRMQALTTDCTREQNRLHAAQQSRQRSEVVINDIEVNIRHLRRRLDEMLKQALRLVREHAPVHTAYRHLTSVRGIAEKSAVELLGELLAMPQELSVREWVAYAGLDVRHRESGSSVRAPGRISKEGNAQLRRVLYMPAQVAIRHEPNVRAFYEKLLARGKTPMVAVVAVMRKLLHSIYGMLKHDRDFDGEKFYQIPAQSA